MRKEPFKIKSITQSLREDYLLGTLTIEQIAIELYQANNTPYVCVDKAKKAIGIQ